MTGERLSDDEVEEALRDLEIWGVQFEKLATRVEFDSYENSVLFANRVFTLATDTDSKPEVTVSGDAVEIDIWTPDTGITSRDVEFARSIEQELRELDL
ncbi:MAG: 4a-hydroxytetrahydrobiopterin dehydratase [Candidatus Nanohaloarchaea archaeon]